MDFKRIGFLFVLPFMGISVLALSLTNPERDSLIDSLSDTLFLKSKLQASLSEEKNYKYEYDNQKALYEKMAVSELSLKQAYWKWRRAEAISRYLSSTVRIKENEVKINTPNGFSTNELEAIYKERWQERLKAARAELDRATEDKILYAYWNGANEKLIKQGAVSLDDVVRTRHLLEGATNQVTEIQNLVTEIQKIVDRSL